VRFQLQFGAGLRYCQCYRSTAITGFEDRQIKFVFKSLFSKKPPLQGAPATRRMKTYSAQSGYVYHYYYEGRRASGSALEFVFTVASGRLPARPCSAFLENGALAAWQRRHSRELSSAEQYALVKMALFQAFDERPSPAAMDAPIRVGASEAEAFSETLGLD